VDRADGAGDFSEQHPKHSEPPLGRRSSARHFIAHKGAVAGAKVLAASVVDFLTDPKLGEEAKTTFKKETAGFLYKSFLPPDQKPPSYLNKELMERYRPLLSKYYLKRNRNLTELHSERARKLGDRRAPWKVANVSLQDLTSVAVHCPSR
jgi:hypothetical protein